MQEILVVTAIAVAIFFLPRLMGKKPEPAYKPYRRSLGIALTGWMRLAILVTILWVAGCAALMKPWANSPFSFFFIGPGPILVFWGVVWVWFGYKKHRR